MAPRISVLTTVYDPEREHLEACLRSVARQEFTDWEHILVNDASTESWVIEVLSAAEAADPWTVQHWPEISSDDLPALSETLFSVLLGIVMPGGVSHDT